MLSRTQKDFYADNGYLVLGGLIPARECDALSDAADAVAGGHCIRDSSACSTGADVAASPASTSSNAR